jgi:hypothetical protein
LTERENRKDKIMRILLKSEFERMNKEVAFRDLEVGMEVTIDDTVDPGWYVVTSKYNNTVELEELEVE